MNEPTAQNQRRDILAQPLRYVRGIGDARADALARMGLTRVFELLFHFPRDYEELAALTPIAQLRPRVPATVAGTVVETELRELGGKRSILGVLLRCDDGFLRCVWFNQPFMANHFRRGQRIVASGVPRLHAGRWEMSHPMISHWNEGDPPPSGGILPIYPLTEGISQPVMRRMVHHLLETHGADVEESMPESIRLKRGLLSIQDALLQIHRPAHRRHIAEARRRFVYQELFVLQLALAVRRRRLTLECRAPELPETPRIRERILRLFPFELTECQHRAIAEIAADMGRPFPMNRMLQGDVGTGKTVVATYAMLLAVAHGRQAVLMAPTEVLARQHMRHLERNLRHGRVRLALLTGQLSRSRRQKTLEAIQQGDVDIVVGTHAIAHAVAKEGIHFARLGLAVIDEQHKFGVRQRAGMKQAGLDPHYLVMTATPIPRTVSMALFGDLDVSILRDAPPGRQEVHTYRGSEENRERWWDFFRRKLAEGRQGYVILPLVDDATDQEAGVEQAFEALASDTLEAFRVGLVHGRMSSEEKDEAMERFAEGETQVLVATSVVEVGIDVPNATLMTIEGGERFGLSQLHQLRGRVSRGVFPGYVCVFASPTSPEAEARLQAFQTTRDGFELAELDFRLRGPGDLFGTRQHGLPPLRIADLTRDADILEEARHDAQSVVEQDPQLEGPEWQRLRRMMLARYGAALELADVG